MAGNTPNRGYRFPTDDDDLNPAVDIENLALDVDADNQVIADAIDAEAASRAASDANLQDQVDNVVHVGTVTDHILFQASTGNIEVDSFGKADFPFPIPFAAPPIVIANNAVIGQTVVVGVDHSTVNATTCVVFAKKLSDGSPAAEGTVISFHWIAVGFRT